jgi:four helix bundle protein
MSDTPAMLDYEKLDVYRCAIEHLALVFKWLALLPRGHAPLADQWRRAATSVPLNIAEASGKPSAADRANKFAIARGEAMECGAILDVVALMQIVPDQNLAVAKDLVERCVRMLTKLCL